VLAKFKPQQMRTAEQGTTYRITSDMQEQIFQVYVTPPLFVNSYSCSTLFYVGMLCYIVLYSVYARHYVCKHTHASPDTRN
jgi:hypothetical protein